MWLTVLVSRMKIAARCFADGRRSTVLPVMATIAVWPDALDNRDSLYSQAARAGPRGVLASRPAGARDIAQTAAG